MSDKLKKSPKIGHGDKEKERNNMIVLRRTSSMT